MPPLTRWRRQDGTTDDMLAAFAEACELLAKPESGDPLVQLTASWDYDDGVSAALRPRGWSVEHEVEGARRLTFATGLRSEVDVAPTRSALLERIGEATAFEMALAELSCTVDAGQGDFVVSVDRDLRTLVICPALPPTLADGIEDMWSRSGMTMLRAGSV